MGYKEYLKELGIDVSNSKQMSDSLGKSNDVMYSNSDVFDYYTTNKNFNLTDNTKLYEIVKIFKDILDKHLFSRHFNSRVDIKNREANFFFEFDNSDEFFIQSLLEMIKARIFMKFKEGLEVNQEMRASDTDVNKTVIIISIKNLD